MAPLSGSSHSFQKLKLDTHAAPKTQQHASTFASFPRHDSQQNGSVRPQLAAPAALDDPAHGLYTTSGQDEDQRANSRVLGYGDGAVVVSGSDDDLNEHDDLEAKFRKRTTSICFDNEVTLDTGNRLSIEDPLPRPARPSAPHSDDQSDDDYLEMPFERRTRRLSHHVGEPRWPLLQSTVDDLATDPEYKSQHPVASLTSGTTASPPLEEVPTPVDLPSDYALSPLSASSPIEFPTFISRRNGSQRSKSYRDIDTEGSYPKFTSRRSSTRSGRSMSSMSPAASFLAMYRRTDAPLKPPEPDEEGQGIGYHGEYIIGKQIGFGGFSVVKEVITIEDGQRLIHAVKIVRKQQQDKTELENEQIQTQLDHEVEIWRFLRHPYILPLLRVYTTDFATFCITRLNKGGTLFDLVRHMRRNQKSGLSAHLVKRYAYQLASAMRYLHNDVMIVHRDIKLENCLIDMTVANAEADGGDILLCDFGMADFVVSDQRDGPEPHSIGANQNIGPADTSTSVVGSLQYAAPELFDAPSWVFSTAADVWAYGVVVYALLTAKLPFNEGLDAKTTMKILRGEWDVDLIRDSPAAQESKVEDAIELVKGCLDMDPDKRWNVNDILTCAWLRGCAEKYESKSCSWITNS